MKDQSIHQVNPEELLPKTNHEKVMTEEFLSVYRQALKYSNLILDEELHYRNVKIYENDHIHELYTRNNKKLPHIVLLHGYGGTSLTFIRTFQHLKDHFQIHALDTFGIGLSSIGNFSQNMTVEETGNYYIDAIEEWRKVLGISSFTLAGHSFGGYIATLYLQKYPQRVQKLLLLSPAGGSRMTDGDVKKRTEDVPLRRRVFQWLAEKIYNMNFRPSKIMNNFFLGNKFMDRVLTNRLKLGEQEKACWKKYLKTVVQIRENSELGFYKLFDWPVQPQRSIQQILRKNSSKVQIDIYFGDNDWMKKDGCQRLAKDFENIKIHEIQNAGHQLIFDNPVSVSDKIKLAHKMELLK